MLRIWQFLLRLRQRGERHWIGYWSFLNVIELTSQIPGHKKYDMSCSNCKSRRRIEAPAVKVRLFPQVIRVDRPESSDGVASGRQLCEQIFKIGEAYI